MEEQSTNQFMIFLSKKMLACDEAGFLISKSRDTKLSFKEKIGLRIHLMTCHICRKYEKQIKQLNRMMGFYKQECDHHNCSHTLSEKSRETIAVAIEKELISK